MAQSQRTHHGIAHFRGEVPRLLAHELRIAGMQAIDRAERAKLVPTGFQMLVTIATHMTANIVTPPSVADIRRGSSEIRLELQGFPRNNGVSREADRIAVRTRASIPREGERPTVVAFRATHVAFGLLDMHFMLIASARLGALFAFAVLIYIAFGRSLVAPGIQVVQVVEHPQRVKSGLASHAALLPVEPPEVNAFGFHTMMHVEVGAYEIRIREVEFHCLFGCGINADALGHRLIVVFERAHAVSRMHVQRGFQAALVQVAQERLMIGKQLLIPRIAGPTGTVFRIDIVHAVPVHVDHGCGEWNAFALEPVHELQVFVLRVAVVAAPPVAECEARQQRRWSGQLVEVLHRFGVAAAIAEEVEVGFRVIAWHNPSPQRIRFAVHFVCFHDHVRGGIIEYRPSVSRNHTIVQRNFAVRLVERARGAFKIMLRFVAVMPRIELGVGHALDDYAQAFFAEWLAIVRHIQRGGVNNEQSVAMRHRELRVGAKIAVDHHLREIVLKFAGIRPFETDQRFR